MLCGTDLLRDARGKLTLPKNENNWKKKLNGKIKTFEEMEDEAEVQDGWQFWC